MGSTWIATPQSWPERILPHPLVASRRSRSTSSTRSIATELGKVYGPTIRFAAATGMRPEVWAALERQDVDRAASVVHVARTHVEGVTKAYGKTSASVREVPLSAAALTALEAVPPRLDTRLVFYGPRGAHVNLRNFRRREWHLALEAAGIPPRRIYDLRSTFASQALAAGVSVFELAWIMGTSVRMIERHYGTLLQGSGDAIRSKLDAYLEGFGPRGGHGRRGDFDSVNEKTPHTQGFREVGGTGLEPVTPSLSSWCSPN